MYTYIKEYKQIHSGQDIYILASGASMDYMSFSFFDGKITIGLNKMYNFYKCTYIIVKDIVTKKEFIQHYTAAKKAGSKFITTDIHNGATHLFITKRDYIVVPVGEWGGFVKPSLLDTDTFVNSHLTITTAIHVAYYLGAKNIILVGADCGLLDGKINIKNYYDNATLSKVNPDNSVLSDRLARTVSHTYNEFNITSLRDALKKKGCNLVSLNPFVNIGLEGHKYTKVAIPEEEMWAGATDKIILT